MVKKCPVLYKIKMKDLLLVEDQFYLYYVLEEKIKYKTHRLNDSKSVNIHEIEIDSQELSQKTKQGEAEVVPSSRLFKVRVSLVNFS